MNEDQTKYLAALRSGEYVQCTLALVQVASDNSREACCLGVAALEFGGTLVELDNDPTSRLGFYKFAVKLEGEIDLISGSRLPDSINEKLGLTYRDNLVMTRLNDILGFNFNRIADTLEGYWTDTLVQVDNLHGYMTRKGLY